MKLKNHINDLVKQFTRKNIELDFKSSYFKKLYVGLGFTIANVYLILPQTKKIYEYFYENQAEVTHIVTQY
jgi:hypothetical protein